MCNYIPVVSITTYKSYIISRSDYAGKPNGNAQRSSWDYVLEIISRGETYGYEITPRLNDLGFTDAVDGTVYTILVRLEKNKLVDIEKKPSDMGPERPFIFFESTRSYCNLRFTAYFTLASL